MMRDRYGNAVSTHSRAALDKYDEALELIRLYQGDPIAALDAALAEDPKFAMAWAARAGVLVQQTDAAYAGEVQRSLTEAAACGGNDQERAHMGAAKAWAEGRMEEATVRYGAIGQANPRDLFAVQTAHIGCFYLGRQADLRDFPLQAMRAISRDDDGYHAIAGMAAFGMEECGDFTRAEALGREAVSLEPRDGWAVHAVAHVNEMRGDTCGGIAWLKGGAEQWAPESGFAYHNWWHLGLLHVDRCEHAEALKIYDAKVRPQPDSSVILEMVDASAMLWRLMLEGVDVGDRFAPLAAAWERCAEDGIYAFNDLHAIMAFLGAGRMRDAERVRDALARAAGEAGDNGYMSRAVGLPLAEGFIAFSAGRYEDCAQNVLATRGIAQRFGGSHAQRDVLTITALHAALRGGLKATAEALAAERVTHKPESPWARTLQQRAKRLAALPEAA